MDFNFNLEALIDFIAAFFKKLLDNFEGLSNFAKDFLGTEE